MKIKNNIPWKKKDELPEGEEMALSKELDKKINDEKIQEYLQKRKIDKDEFVKFLEERSKGDLEYVDNVIREIKNGVYQDTELENLPNNIDEYYRGCFERSLDGVNQAEREIKLKTIYVLSDMSSPISTSYLTNILETQFQKIDESKIKKILEYWKDFLKVDERDGVKKYSFHYQSFLDFLKREDIIEEVGFDYDDVNNIILDYMTKGLIL